MFKLRIAALAAASGLALVATPALASNGCEFSEGAEDTVGNPNNAEVTNQQAMEQLVAARLPANTPAECRPFVVSESLRLSGLNPTAWLVHGTKMKVATVVKYTPPAPKLVATATVPTPVPSATSDVVAAQAAARRAEAAVAEAQRDRDAAAVRVQRTSRPGVSRAEVASATNALRAAEGKLAEMRRLASAAQASARAAATSARQSADSAASSALSATGASRSEENAAAAATRAEAAATRAEATDDNISWWTPQWWWFAILLSLGALVTWWLTSRKPEEVDLTGYATTEDLKVYAKQEDVDNLGKDLAETNRQVGKKVITFEPHLVDNVLKMNEGDERDTEVTVDVVVYKVGLRKEAGPDVKVTGVTGHTFSNAVKVGNLIDMLTNAAWGGRLKTKA